VKTGQTHLNFPGKAFTMLILIETFGSPTQMIRSRFAPQGAFICPPEASFDLLAIRIEPNL